MSAKKIAGIVCFAAIFIVVLLYSFITLKAFRSDTVNAAITVTSSDFTVSPGDTAAMEEYIETIAVDFTTPTAGRAVIASNNRITTRTAKPSQTNVSPYVITVYLKSQSVVVYRAGADGKAGEAVKRFVCSSGLSSSTPVGNFHLIRRFRWRLLSGNVYGQYSTTITGNILFHSVPYAKKDPSTLKNEEYDKLGRKASLGCIRLCVRDAKWIFDNAPNGTPVSIVNQSGPAGYSPPKRNPDLLYRGWDPTDKWSAGNPYFTHTTESDTTSGETTDQSEPTQTSSSRSSETSDPTSAASSTSASAVTTTASAAGGSGNPDSVG